MIQAQPRRGNRAALAVLAGFALLFFAGLGHAQAPPTYTVTTIVGMGPPAIGGKTGDGGPATSAQINGPTSVILDSKGNLYFADQFNNVIRSVIGGTINEFGGNASDGYSGDGGPATSAALNFPGFLAIDSKGNIYFSDVSNDAVRMITPSGTISTVAGSQSLGGGAGGDGGVATNAQLNKPSGIALDSAGNLYIADTANFKIREVAAGTGIISTIAGNSFAGYSNANGVATQAQLNLTQQMAVDSRGALYIADSLNNQIRKIVNGVISLVAGSPTAIGGFAGDEGLAVNALLDYPTGVAVDSSGNVYICDLNNNRVRMVTPDGLIHTIAGSSAPPGYSGDGGPALSAQFDEPYSITVDSSGKLYVCDLANNIIRLLTPNAAPGGPGAVPVVATGGVISASGFGAIPSIAPGSWIEIYGTSLAPTTRGWAASDFSGINAPTQLNRTSVTIGSQSAFVEYISPGQINAQVPGTIGLGTQQVTVTTAAGTSAAVNVMVNLEQPGLYAPAVFRIVGKQYLGAQFADGTYVFPVNSFAGITSRPAKPGDTIIIYGIGFGPVPGNPPGQIPQAANGLTLPLQPKFYFNGVQAQVSYAGLVPGFIGEYQFNVIIPSITVPAGQVASVPVTFTVNENGVDVPGVQTVYTAIQN